MYLGFESVSSIFVDLEAGNSRSRGSEIVDSIDLLALKQTYLAGLG